MVCFFSFVYFYLLLPDFKQKIVLDLIKESLKTRTKHLLNEDLIEVKLEPDDLHDSIVNISKHTKTISNNSELFQNIFKSGNLMTGRIFLNCSSSTI